MQKIITEGYQEQEKTDAQPTKVKVAHTPSVQPAPDVPKPPFWGSKTIDRMSTEIVLTHLHKMELFRLSWGAKNTHGEEWEKLSADFEDRLRRMTKKAIRNKWIYPQAVYGYFPANADGDDLVVYDPEPFASGDTNKKIEIAR